MNAESGFEPSSENECHRGYLSKHSAGFRFKPQMAFEEFSFIIIHVIIAVASFSASAATHGNSIDPQWYMFGIPNMSNSYRCCLIGWVAA